MRKMFVLMFFVLLLSCHDEIQIRKIFNIPENPWELNEQKESKEILPCVVFKNKQSEYNVVSGDCLYMVFGHNATDSLLGKDKKIFPNQKISFPTVGCEGIMDVKGVWNNFDAETLFVVLRDKNEAYLIINGGEFDADTVVWSTKISTGRKGKITPKGIFEIKRKNRWARSITYDAPMYYGHQLFENNKPTGYWIHEGYVTGKPASHGCVRVPKAWAQELWELTHIGLKVLIIDSKDLGRFAPFLLLKENHRRSRSSTVSSCGRSQFVLRCRYNNLKKKDIPCLQINIIN